MKLVFLRFLAYKIFNSMKEVRKFFYQFLNYLKKVRKNYADGTLRILNSNYREVAKVKFNDLFPTSLTSLDFDATNTDVQYFTAEATFKYTIYNLSASN